MSGAHVIIAHAVIKKRNEEEENMGYKQDELENDWEFKILRSAAGEFKKYAIVEQAKLEEAAAGWVMVEKFDNNRIRFKRPASAVDDDINLPEYIDPYKTTYGRSEGTFALSIIAVIALVIGTFITIGVLTGNM